MDYPPWSSSGGAADLPFNFTFFYVIRKPTMWVFNMSNTNQAVQEQKMAGHFSIQKVEEVNYSCSENKGADQLRSYYEAGLRLCFCICKMLDLS